MLGYCSTGKAFIQTRPAMTIISETTVAKIGCSMKNFENMFASLRYLLFFSDLTAGGAPSGVAGFSTRGFGATATPDCRPRPPSTTTTSPARSPSVINQSLPYQSPTTTGRDSALLSLVTTQTECPLAP